MENSMMRFLQQEGHGNKLLSDSPIPPSAPVPEPAAALSASGGAKPLTNWQTLMHGMADASQQIADNPIFGEMASGDHLAAYDRQRAMMGAVKHLAKSADPIMREMAHVAGGDVSYDGTPIWDSIKDGFHNDMRDSSSDMRGEIRKPENVRVNAASPHVDVRPRAKRFAENVREVAADKSNEWIERKKGDDDLPLHPDDQVVLADHAKALKESLEGLMSHLSASHHADWRQEELRAKPDGELHYVPVPRHLREHPVSLDVDLHEQIRDAAEALREEMNEEEEEH